MTYPQREFQITSDSINGQRAIENAAILAYEANRGYATALGDLSFTAWSLAPQWQKDTNLEGVRQIVKDPDTTHEESHESWMKKKVEDGWVYGEVKDPEKKTHPCMVPYAQLPAAQRRKDAIFGAVVRETLFCYGDRTMTNQEVRLPQVDLPYSATDVHKTYGVVQTQGRALRIASAASSAYLDATEYPIPGEKRWSELAHTVLLCACAPTPVVAYDWHRAAYWPQILMDFPELEDIERAKATHPLSALAMERSRVQWFMVYNLVRAVCMIDGVRFRAQDEMHAFTTSWRFANAQASDEVMRRMGEAVASEIIKKEDQAFLDEASKR